MLGLLNQLHWLEGCKQLVNDSSSSLLTAGKVDRSSFVGELPALIVQRNCPSIHGRGLQTTLVEPSVNVEWGSQSIEQQSELAYRSQDEVSTNYCNARHRLE